MGDTETKNHLKKLKKNLTGGAPHVCSIGSIFDEFKLMKRSKKADVNKEKPNYRRCQGDELEATIKNQPLWSQRRFSSGPPEVLSLGLSFDVCHKKFRRWKQTRSLIVSLENYLNKQFSRFDIPPLLINKSP